jgi:hypothetical protein
MSRPYRAVNVLHPVLQKIVPVIQREIIDPHNIPMRIFETGRTVARQQELVTKKKARTLVSRYIYDLGCSPALYSSAISYVFYDTSWSWNIRNLLIRRWFELFGELVMDQFSDRLEWGGYWRRHVDYTYFQVRQSWLELSVLATKK